MDLVEMLPRVGLYFVPFLFALCFHEYAHGWVAKKKGDRTAELMGRLTLNPIAHIDWIGTVLLPVTGIITGLPVFGWAKPVPVNERNLKRPRDDMFWIALAGPASNVLLAILAVIGFVFAQEFLIGWNFQSAVIEFLRFFLIINLFLAFFNMIPLHPLDGGKVLARFLPNTWNFWLEENQSTLSIALIVVFVMGGFRYLAIPVFYFAEWAVALVTFIVRGVA